MDKWEKNMKNILFIFIFSGLFSTYCKEEETEKVFKKIKKIKPQEEEKKEKTFSANEDIKKIIALQNKKIEEQEKNKEKIILKPNSETEKQTEENEKIQIPLKSSKNLTEEYKDKLIKLNTLSEKKKLKKYIPVVKEFLFLQHNFADLLYFFKNLKYQKHTHIYDLNIRLLNVVWGINISTGLDIGFSLIKKNDIENKVFFMNVNLGYKYAKQGHIEVILGCSRVKYNNKYIWPLWFAITPLNFDFDIYHNPSKSPIAINLNIQFLFKTLITEDMRRCIGKIWETDKNKILPYMGDLSNPNFLDIFFDLKIYLGFKYINEIY